MPLSRCKSVASIRLPEIYHVTQELAGIPGAKLVGLHTALPFALVSGWQHKALFRAENSMLRDSVIMSVASQWRVSDALTSSPKHAIRVFNLTCERGLPYTLPCNPCRNRSSSITKPPTELACFGDVVYCLPAR